MYYCVFQDYPLNPPKMRFISKIFHPNIYPDGRVCISILHAPGDDPLGYETSSERWSPVQSVEKVLLSVMSMLAEPNCESPANVDAAKMWRDAVSAVRLSGLCHQVIYFSVSLRLVCIYNLSLFPFEVHVHWSALIRSTFYPRKIDHKTGLTLCLG